MRREDCHIGQPVIFGRGHGEQTKGIIRKLNLKSAKVETTEDRGSRGVAGAVWTVGYSLMRADSSPVTATQAITSLAAPKPTMEEILKKIVYSPFNHINNGVMELICQVYSDLSPENLSCDGERPISQVNSARKELNRILHHLQQIIGREVDEMEAYTWSDKKREWEREQDRMRTEREQNIAKNMSTT